MIEKIYEFLEEIRPEHNFHDSEDYIEDGLLDSFDIVSLVDMLEEEFEIEIDGLDIVPESFASAEAIVALVEKCKGETE